MTRQDIQYDKRNLRGFHSNSSLALRTPVIIAQGRFRSQVFAEGAAYK